MKKVKYLVCMAWLCGGMATLFPCDIAFATAKIKENGKSKICVTIVVDKIHGRCPVGIEKTRLLGSGVTIEKQSPWTSAGGSAYQSELTVTLKQGEKAEIRVVRDCPKTGTQEETLRLDPR